MPLELAETRFFQDPDLISYWRFEGNRKDAKRGGNDGTDSGVVNSVVGKFGQGVSTGTGKIDITETTSLGLTNFSVFCWVNNVGGGFNPIMRRSAAFLQGWMLFVNSGEFKGYIGTGSDHDIASGVTITTGWHHVGMTYDNNNALVYVDGQLRTSTAVGAIVNSGNLKLLRDDLNAGSFSGTLDDVAIFGRVLTASQISELYSANRFFPLQIINSANVARTEAISDTVGITNSFSYVLSSHNFTANLSDTVDITATLGPISGHPFASSDTVGITSTLTIGQKIIISDTVGVTGALLHNFTASLSDTVGLESSVTLTGSYLQYDTFRPVPNPGNTRILVCRTPLGLHDSVEGMQEVMLWTLDTDGSNEFPVVRTPTENGWVSYSHPEWAPDSNNIVVVVETSDSYILTLLNSTGFGQ